MTTKTITITEEAYNGLKKHKSDEESFSQFFKRKFPSKLTLEELPTIFTDKGAMDLKSRIRASRKKFDADMEERNVRIRHHFNN